VSVLGKLAEKALDALTVVLFSLMFIVIIGPGVIQIVQAFSRHL